MDDEPNVRLVYKDVLTDRGYKVLEAESGEETFQILNSEAIDLVVLDIKLRLESGLNVLQRIIKEFPSIPVVLFSAYPSLQNDYTCWLAKGYFVKSGNPEDLLKEIDKFLSEKRESK